MRNKINHIICIAVTLAFAAIAFFVFPNALGRTVESVRDFGLSIADYFVTLFGFPDAITSTVTQNPDYSFLPYLDMLFPDNTATAPPDIIISDTAEGFAAQWVAYWQTFASLDNLLAYLTFAPNILYNISVVLLMVIPFAVLLIFAVNRALKTENNDYGHESRPLRAFKRAAVVTYYPVKAWLSQFIRFVKEHKPYYIIWVVMWCYSLNLITITIEFFAYYFYLVSCFDFTTLYGQVYKLCLDLYVPLKFIPVWLWITIAIAALFALRRKIAYARLNHMERRNRGFINARPIVTMACGTMGKGKTTAITDMALSQSVMFRDKAFELLLENDLKFPYFPWINFENEIKREMRKKRIYNLATCRTFVRKRKKLFDKLGYMFERVQSDKRAVKSLARYCRRKNYGHANLCFGYDYARYGLKYDDKLQVFDLWQVLESYACLYFIYAVQSSLLISNYSIRSDELMSDLGNFPLWDSDFFKRDSRLIDCYSRHAHILDFDMLRLGRKVIEDNPNKDALEFGVVVCTEIGKERGNNLELKEVKKKTDETNQKNDLFNSSLKMIRHRATIDNFCFICFFTDEQRPSSWGADARDLCEIVHIRKQTERRLAMPFFTLGELLHYVVFGKFTDMYTKYRYKRGDTTLFMHLVKSVSSALHRYYIRTYNLFGYKTQLVQIESGTMDENYEDGKYYLMSKKIYAKRFSTDCYSEYFLQKALKAKVGIKDFREYVTEKAKFTELQYENSYFIDDMVNVEKLI